MPAPKDYLSSAYGKYSLKQVEKCEAFADSKKRLPFCYENPQNDEERNERKLRVFMGDFMRESKNNPEADALQKRISAITDIYPLEEYNSSKNGVSLQKDLNDMKTYCAELERFPVRLKYPKTEIEIRGAELRKRLNYYSHVCTPHNSTLLENDLRITAKRQIMLYRDVYCEVFAATNEYIKKLEEMLKLFIEKSGHYPATKAARPNDSPQDKFYQILHCAAISNNQVDTALKDSLISLQKNTIKAASYYGDIKKRTDIPKNERKKLALEAREKDDLLASHIIEKLNASQTIRGLSSYCKYFEAYPKFNSTVKIEAFVAGKVFGLLKSAETNPYLNEECKQIKTHICGYIQKPDEEIAGMLSI